MRKSQTKTTVEDIVFNLAMQIADPHGRNNFDKRIFSCSGNNELKEAVEYLAGKKRVEIMAIGSRLDFRVIKE